MTSINQPFLQQIVTSRERQEAKFLKERESMKVFVGFVPRAIQLLILVALPIGAVPAWGQHLTWSEQTRLDPTPYPVHGDHPECAGNVTPDQMLVAVSEVGAGTAAAALGGDPTTVVVSADIAGALAAKFGKKFQDYAACSIACARLPTGARVTETEVDISPNGKKGDEGQWVPFPKNVWGAGGWPNVFVNADHADKPEPDGQHYAYCLQFRNWSHDTGYYGQFLVHFDWP